MSENTGATNIAVHQEQEIRARVHSGASWFIWIGALSIINALIVTFGGNFVFIFGLGITQLVSAIPPEFPVGAKAAAWIVNIVIAGVFALFGKFAREPKKWAFYAGMALYALDALLVLLVRDWFGLAFHAYALFCIYRGLKAANELDELRPAALAAGVGTIG